MQVSDATVLERLSRCAEHLRESRALERQLGPVLRVLSEDLGFQRATLARVDRALGSVQIEAAHGLTPTEVSRGRWEPGEGITGRVASSGSAIRVPDILVDPRFLDRTGMLSRGAPRAFVCVPVLDEGEVLATLSAFVPPTSVEGLAPVERVLVIVAAMLGPSVRAGLVEQRREASSVGPGNIIGRSKPMRNLYQLMDQVASSPTTVLLLGESGTGKELVASALHQGSERRRGAFVGVNCAALPEGVVESELFGHERGAFTGAHQRRIGRFEAASGGTLFLDEVGDLPLSMQAKLLRVLQERTLERVGSTTSVPVDVRVVAATSRDLQSMVSRGEFRADLYYRLHVFPIHMPPLRERGPDVLLLADHFVEVFNRAHGKAVRRIATSAIDMLMAYHWPGNVRELENCMERAVLMAREGAVLGHHLPPTLQTAEHSGTRSAHSLAEALATLEEELLRDALKSHRGNMAAAARALGITERMIGTRVTRYAIEPKRYKGR